MSGKSRVEDLPAYGFVWAGALVAATGALGSKCDGICFIEKLTLLLCGEWISEGPSGTWEVGQEWEGLRTSLWK